MSNDSLRLILVEPESGLLQEVVQLGNANKRYLGFLPDEGFTDRAWNRTLLAAADVDQLAGYVLFDLPANRVRVVHLCVAADHRNKGVARELIQAVSHMYRERTGLELACRRDFPANALWRKLDFTPVGERPGRSPQGFPLTIWRYDHGHPTLFTDSIEERELAAIDHNVLQDLCTDRPQGAESRALDQDWTAELLELCITDEALYEVDGCGDQELRRKMQRHASAFRNLSRGSVPWKRLVPAAARAAPGAGEADHRHVARAAAAGATYFVTRDDDLVRVASPVEGELGIIVIRPEDLILRLDRLRSQGRYEPQALQGTSISAMPAADLDQRAFVAAFLNTAWGERNSQLSAIVRPALAAPAKNTIRVYRDRDGRLVAALIYGAVGGHLEVKLLRIATRGRLAAAVGRQLAFLARKAAADQRLSRVVITDPHPSPPAVLVLEDEAFYLHPEAGWVCDVEVGLTEQVPETRSPATAAALERRLWPRKVLGTGLPTFMVSIGSTWAEQLFDHNLAAATLFARDDDLGLSREHVYYRSPGASGGISHPARILWYVTGGAVGHERGHLRAVSMLQEVVIGNATYLFRRFTRLGTWNQQQVLGAANAKGTVMALRFSDTEVLENPLSLDQLRNIYVVAGETFQAPRGPRRASERTFRLLYERGSAYVN